MERSKLIKRHNDLQNPVSVSTKVGNNAMPLVDNRPTAIQQVEQTKKLDRTTDLGRTIQRILIDVGNEEDKKELKKSKEEYIGRELKEGASAAKKASRIEGQFEGISELKEGEKVHIWGHYSPNENKIGTYTPEALVDKLTEDQKQIDGLKNVSTIVLNACSTALIINNADASYATKVAVLLSRKLEHTVTVKAALGPTFVKEGYDVVTPNDAKYQEYRKMEKEIEELKQQQTDGKIDNAGFIKKYIKIQGGDMMGFFNLKTEIDKKWPLKELKGKNKVIIKADPDKDKPTQEEHKTKSDQF